ncbi:MAG: fumarylacetoacetate hydrolase family protein [Deltaproteobacteria bacterium]|nr:fumarylacetoacetate hydrolase family protein [Deltaproteobacteria bacterium]
MRPRFEIWFAVVLDESRRRALWVRRELFDGRPITWGAWFDGDVARAAKRFADTTFSDHGATGAVDGMSWDVQWTGGTPTHGELPTWLPAPTHAKAIVHDAIATATVTVDGEPIELRGRALAMHLWGKRRVPTLHWIWTPWLGDGSLEVTAVSLRDRIAMGVASLALDGPHKVEGSPATAAHPGGIVTATIAGARRLVHARAWAEPQQMVGYAYRDTDGRDLMVAQSDVGSAQLEVFQRTAPGLPWKLVDERRADGGVAVEIHQHAPLPGVDYVAWDATQLVRREAPARAESNWPEVTAIVALGLTYADHIRETGQRLRESAPPIAFAKHVRTFAPGGGDVHVPTAAELRGVLDAASLLPAIVPAVMDYEGELALVALGDIDEAQLAAGVAQPFGLAACNDLTARVLQVLGEGEADPYVYWAAAKSFERFLPCAERVWAPPGGITAIPELTLTTLVNGEERQRASTKLIIYDLPTIVRAARTVLGRPLARGDVIATGTPAGVGMRMGAVKRRLAALVKDRARKAELLVSAYATSSALLRPGDVIEVDAGPAGRVRTRLVV